LWTIGAAIQGTLAFRPSDDVEFGKTGFAEWCRSHAREPKIDLLFIDTSHLREHTKKEMEAWEPHLSDQATVLFHDTNMGAGPYARLDGSVGYGYDNERGVIAEIEELLDAAMTRDRFSAISRRAISSCTSPIATA